MGDFPWMTERGTFIINGTERVVVTQLVRSPGAYLMEPKDREKQVFTANLMPARGSLARARDRQEGQGLRPHRPQAQAAGHRPAARDGLQPRDRRGASRRRHEDIERLDQELLRPLRQLALHPQHDRRRHRGDEDQEGRADRALQEAAPGRAAERRRRLRAAAAAVLRPQALRPHARRPLQAQLAPRPRHRPRHAHADARRHPRARPGARQRCRKLLGIPEDGEVEIKDYAAEAVVAAARAGRRATSTSTSTSATAACAPSAS